MSLLFTFFSTSAPKPKGHVSQWCDFVWCANRKLILVAFLWCCRAFESEFKGQQVWPFSHEVKVKVCLWWWKCRVFSGSDPHYDVDERFLADPHLLTPPESPEQNISWSSMEAFLIQNCCQESYFQGFYLHAAEKLCRTVWSSQCELCLIWWRDHGVNVVFEGGSDPLTVSNL